MKRPVWPEIQNDFKFQAPTTCFQSSTIDCRARGPASGHRDSILCCQELASALMLSCPTCSRHLKLLALTVRLTVCCYGPSLRFVITVRRDGPDVNQNSLLFLPSFCHTVIPTLGNPLLSIPLGLSPPSLWKKFGVRNFARLTLT